MDGDGGEMIAIRLEWEDAEDVLPEYEEVVSLLRMDVSPPEGMLVHSVGVSERGSLQVFEVWQTREHVEAFYEDALMPAAKAVTGGAPATPVSAEVYEVHNLIRAC